MIFCMPVHKYLLYVHTLYTYIDISINVLKYIIVK